MESIWNFIKNKRLFFIGISLICFLSSIYQLKKLELNEDISAFVPQDSTTAAATQLLTESGFSDKIIFNLYDSLGEEFLVPRADSILSALQKAEFKPFIKRIDYQTSDTLLETYLNIFYGNLPLFLSDSDLQLYTPLLTETGTDSILLKLKEKIESPISIFSNQYIQIDPIGMQSLAWNKLKNLQPDGNFELVEGRVYTKNHQNLLLFLTPAFPANNTKKNGELLDRLEPILKNYPNCSIYGGPIVAVSNSRQMKKDTLLTSILAVLLILLLMVWFFRSTLIPLLLFLPVLFGAVCALGVLSVWKGEISVIAIAAGSIVLGIAINYALHFITHLHHERSIDKTLKEIVRPMLVGCITTAGAFFTLSLVKSQALQQLGLYAGFALLFSALFTLFIFPLFFNENRIPAPQNKLGKWLSYPFEKNKWVLLSVLFTTLFLALFSNKADFEKDLMKVNFLDEKTLQAEKNLESISSNSIRNLFLANKGTSIDAALETNEKLDSKLSFFLKQGQIQHFISPSTLIPSISTQSKKQQAWNSFWTPEKIKTVETNLARSCRKQGFKPNAFSPFIQTLKDQTTFLNPNDLEWLRFTFFKDFFYEKDGTTYLFNQIKTEENNREGVAEDLNNSGLGIVLDKQYLTKKFIRLVGDDFNTILYAAGGIVFLVLLLSYGRIELTLINFLPMVLSWIWLLGLMGIFGIKFNIVNIIIGTLLFGLGDDYSIFVLGGQLEEFKTGKKILPSFKSSIFLSALTTLIGVGVLIFAKHPALQSIAIVTILGMLGVLIISFTISPFLFGLLALERKKKNYLPYTALAFILSFIAFFYFLIGCSILNIIGFFQFKVLRQKSPSAKLFFHRCLSWFTGSLVYLMANVKKKIINEGGETFEKPAILISNHQSFLDILTIQMLSPRMILLTNQWVWNSPFFGTFIKYADYLPVADGIEQNVEKLKAIVDQGYSILIWPEGTRSPDGKMKRFHKGAFLLAQELQLDIVPIITHGTGHTMSKGDFLLKNGEITLKILPRIKANKQGQEVLGLVDFGETPAELAKNIGKWFREQYRTLCFELETTRYYREKLIKNYLYKGPILEWYARIKISLENNYEPFHQLVPLSGKITDIGCGYGFLSWMLSFLSPERTILGLDYDEEKIEVAKHISTQTGNVTFLKADIVKQPLENSDVFIMADVLHYLMPHQQETILKQLFSKLNPNGKIILRDGDADLLNRQKGTWLTELLSTKIFGFNKTQNQLHFISGQWLRSFALTHGFLVQEVDSSKLTSNKVWILTAFTEPVE